VHFITSQRSEYPDAHRGNNKIRNYLNLSHPICQARKPILRYPCGEADFTRLSEVFDVYYGGLDKTETIRKGEDYEEPE